MHDVGIVGGGISGLHLGIRLLDLGERATIYHAQTGAEIERGPMLNSVVHQYDTVRREQEMGIDFWNESNVRVGRGHDLCINIPGRPPLRFWGAFENCGSGVDYRLMIPRLMAELERRGGTLVHAAKTSDDRGSAGPTRSRRGRCREVGGGLRGSVRRTDRAVAPPRSGARVVLRTLRWHRRQRSVRCHTEPVPRIRRVGGLPMESLGGATYALLFENLPGEPASYLAEIDRKDDPEKFLATVLGVVEEFHPATYDRIDRAQFRLHDDNALLHGGLRPVVRRAYARRVASTPVMSIGDLRVTMDPVTAQEQTWSPSERGCSPSTSRLTAGPFDLGFAERYSDAVAPRTAATVGFNNLVLAPPDYFVGLLMEMSANQAMCDEFTEGFTEPEHLWFDIVRDAETAAAFAASHR